MISSFNRWVDANNVVLILITLYFFISIIKLEHPGVNGDSLMFVNAATLNPENPFLWKSFNGFPVMIFPYIGALKSYLYMPIFYLFGVNIWSIRLPQIILISCSLYLLYKSLILGFNRQIGILTVLFLSLDPSLITYSRADNGPTVLEFFLKVSTIYLFFLYHQTRKGIFFISIYPLLALGIFNKINFFWFVNAFMVSLIIFYLPKFYNDFKSYGRYFIISFTALILVPYYLLLRLFLRLSKETALSYKQFGREVDISNIFTNLPIFYENLTKITNGNLFFGTLYGYEPTAFGGYFATLVFSFCLIFLIYVIIKYKSFDKSFIKPYFFISSIFILISLQILLTKRALSAWHVLVLYPFFTILLAAGIFQLYKLSKWPSIKIILIFLIISIFFYQMAVNYLYLSKYSAPTKSISWSSSIYNLIDFAKYSDNKFICLDIDICVALLSFTQKTGKFSEPFNISDPTTYHDLFTKLSDKFKNPQEFLYVAHGDTISHFPAFKQSFFNYLRDNKINYIKVKEFKDGEIVAFEIYRIGNF